MAAARSIRRGERGFTLVEMLAVIFIIGLASAIVVLTMPPPEGPVEEAAERFVMLSQRAADEAIVSGNVVGIRIDERGYEFARYRGGAWIALPGFQGDDWPLGATVDLQSEAMSQERRMVERQPGEEPLPPLVTFDPTGAATPFTLRLEDHQRRFVITSDPGANFTLERGDV